MKELIQIYSEAMPTFEKVSSEHKGVSGPLFISVPPDYVRTEVRLMIVGQQTHGWPRVTVGLKKLLQTYQDFNLGRKYTKSAFWQASHKVYKSLNPNGPERAFLWSNLLKVDIEKNRPSSKIEEAICELRLLPEEIRILKPNVVIFFTGPDYEDRLKKTFPNVEYRKLSPFLSQLTHSNLPMQSFQTYHPGHLWRKGKQEILDDIVAAIRAS